LTIAKNTFIIKIWVAENATNFDKIGGCFMYKKLREHRLQNNISVDELCKLISVDVSNYYRREQGETEFKLEEAKKICEFLNAGMEIFEIS